MNSNNNLYYEKYRKDVFFIIRNLVNDNILNNLYDEIFSSENTVKHYDRKGAIRRIEKIFDKDHGVWNIGMSVTAPIFNAGRLRSVNKIQKLNYENSKQDLIQGILNAFSEIEQYFNG